MKPSMPATSRVKLILNNQNKTYHVWSTSVHAFVPCAKQRLAMLSRIPL